MSSPSPTPPVPRSPARRLFDLSLPAIGLNFLNVLALAVDTAMCGHLADSETSLNALGYGTQLIFLLMITVIGMTVGSVALVSRAFGAGQHDRVHHILQQSTQLTVILGVTVTVVGNLLAPYVLTLLGADDAARALGLDFLSIILLGSPFFYLTLLYGAVLRGVGNTRLAFWIALCTNLINAALNYGLIFGHYGLPAMGVKGAAIGTVISQVVGVVLFVMILRRNRIPGVRLRMRVVPIDRELTRRLADVGWPAALDMFTINVSFFFVVGMLGRLDHAAVAAHTVGLRIQALAFLPGLAISQATSAMVGQALGAGRVEEARQVLRAAIVLAVIIMGAIALPIFVFAPSIVPVFGVSPASPVGEYAILWMRLLGLAMPAAGIGMAFVGLLQGAGNTRQTLLISFWCNIVFQIPASWLLGFPLALGVGGVWGAFACNSVIKATWGYLAYKQGAWARVGATA